MAVVRLIKKILAIPMLLAINIIMLLLSAISLVYTFLADYALLIIAVFMILAVIFKEWMSLAVLGGFLVTGIVVIYCMAWLMAMLADGREYFESVIF